MDDTHVHSMNQVSITLILILKWILEPRPIFPVSLVKRQVALFSRVMRRFCRLGQGQVGSLIIYMTHFEQYEKGFGVRT